LKVESVFSIPHAEARNKGTCFSKSPNGDPQQISWSANIRFDPTSKEAELQSKNGKANGNASGILFQSVSSISTSMTPFNPLMDP